jgi:hypothetical protein
VKPIPDEMVEKWPTIRYEALRAPASLGAFCQTFDWALGLIRAG